MDEAFQTEAAHVNLFAKVEDESVEEVVEAIHSLTLEDRERPIHLHLFTTGGDLSAAMALIDVMQAGYTAPVRTYAWGDVCSAGVFVLAAGSRRAVGRNANVMLHPLSGDVGAPVGRGVQAAAESFARVEAAAWEWLDGATGQVLGYWYARTMAEVGVWLDAQGTVDVGLADMVVEVKR